MEAFYTSLYRTYQSLVYQQAYRMTGSRWMAEDMVQEVFIRVWLHREELAAIKDIKAWLLVITRRQVFDALEKRSRQRRLLSGYHLPALTTDSSDALLHVRYQRLLAEAEQRLSPRARQVYYLQHIKGLDKHQIASTLHIAEFTALYYIKSAANTLKKYMQQQLTSQQRA